MTDIALRVTGLGKQYRLGISDHAAGKFHRYKSLRDSLSGFARRPWQVLGAGRAPMSEKNSFWALQDIDFEVHRGEVVGIIGRNGAGKSTLLKILSRITKPTTGRVDLFGRVGSLLEVGTGFHPELSGRENIFLNGAVLGMTRTEVRHKFDEIVAFSEVETFLDTPVKQYSSGMYMRLAFAVAAHLEPEILVVDEVLAVGDAAFQKKCLGKMKDVAETGRTVLFVSHNMAAVQQLCTRGLLLSGGRVLIDGSTNDAVGGYFASTDMSADFSRRRASGFSAWINSASAAAADGGKAITPQSGVRFTTVFKSPGKGLAKQPVMGVVIRNTMGNNVGAISTRITGFVGREARAGTMSCNIQRLPLLPGRYTADLWFGDGATDLDCVEEAVEFTVDFTDVYGSGQLAPGQFGPLVLEPTWKLDVTDDVAYCDN